MSFTQLDMGDFQASLAPSTSDSLPTAPEGDDADALDVSRALLDLPVCALCRDYGELRALCAYCRGNSDRPWECDCEWTFRQAFSRAYERRRNETAAPVR